MLPKLSAIINISSGYQLIQWPVDQDGHATTATPKSGDKPVCARCHRLGRSCIYTPTRRSGHPGPSPPPIGVPAAPAEPFLSRLNVRERRYYGIPPDLLPALLDLYFTHLYNASLLFHRPSLIAAVESETVRADILLSICALASKFYTDANGCTILIDNRFSHEWAQAAGRLAFQEIETPSQDNIVVFLNLSLFWYSVGQFQRSGMLSGTMRRQHCLDSGAPPDSHGKQNPLELEIRRRRFWGCYLFCGFHAGSLFPKIPTDDMLNARLPCSEAEFALGKPHATISLRSGESTQSIYGELVRAMALWSSVLVVIKQSDSSIDTRLGDIQILDRRIHEGRAKLSEHFPLDCANMTSIPVNEIQRLLLVHIIYHQCLCSLHSSIVPLFSWSPCDDAFSYVQQLSAQTAFENANAMSALLETALTLDWDSRKMPSFIGYAAYCACAIQTPFLWCSKPEVKQCAVRSILANLKALQVLGNHWTFLNVLGKFAFALYKVHESRPFPLADEPKNMPPAALRGFKPANPRARLSILAHNSIIVSEQGSLVKGTEEIGDLGLNETGTRDPAMAGEENISNLISQISGQVRDFNAQMPLIMDPFFGPGNSEFYARDGGMGSSSTELQMGQCGYIEDWITELLRQEV
ncbi:hypothetical protein PT974_03053 [Cladobotryum mycophilum]|uniref:Xylanolytic transcriptional activator regulatory domain-containing protein n=1 Tax=Cladobotryum mycophilum TaxID=491253 RepID=A0ABR0SVW2_9HYPO